MTAIPYIGSRISLISKNEIRYEGILYSIDPKESKVALQNVRSYGTEDRKKEVIPPSNEVYDYIIFRGSEIKDLTVCEAPRQAPMIPDSAILAMPHLAQTQFNTFGGQPNYPNMNIPPNYAQPFGGFNPYYHSFFGFQAMNQSGQPGGQSGGQPGQSGQPGGQQSTPTPTPTPQATSQATSQVTPSPAQPKEVKASTPAQPGVSDVKSKTPTSVASPQEGQTSATTVQSSAPTPTAQAPTTPIAGPVPTAPTLSPPTTTTIPTTPTTTTSASITPPTAVPTTQDSETSDSQDQGSRYSGRKSTQRPPGDRRGGAGNGAGSGNQRGRRGGRYTTTNGPRVLEEFDFESMNAKFDKVKVAEEITKSTTKEENETTPEEGAREAVDSAPVETVAPSYNKTKSFFDSISCDALDRISEQNTNDKGKARKTYQEQRKLDEETFGRSGYGNRGNQRGGRGGRRYYSGNQPRENGTGAREGSSNYRGNDRQANKTYNRQ